MGIETEFGIQVEGKEPSQLIEASIALVRAYSGISVGGWNYRNEDPRRDLRGFKADHLATDPNDTQFDMPNAPHLTPSEEHSDRVLANGARLYNDHGHPEYATPECSRIRDLVAHDKAGERIVWECAQLLSSQWGKAVRIYKNNTDYHGASYGTHEDYLMSRKLSSEQLIGGMMPFLVTRQLFAGAGKVGVENSNWPPSEVVYQLSQRADFAAVEASVDTLNNRPIFNTRDEPHTLPKDYRRLHVIIGDANMSEYATALKVGTTALVIKLLETGWQPQWRILNPVEAIKYISRDQSYRWQVEMEGGPAVPAIDIQRSYLVNAQERFKGHSVEVDWILSQWSFVLDRLDADPMKLSDRLDWVAKKNLLDSYQQEMNIGWGDPMLQSLDLAYHDIDPDIGLYYGLEQAGAVCSLVHEEQIEAARSCPPQDTRAFLRGWLVRHFPQAIKSISWSGIVFEHEGENLLFDMKPLVGPGVSSICEEVAAANDLNELIQVIRSNGQFRSDGLK